MPPVTFPSTISTKYFSNFFETRDPSCSFSHELCFVFQSSSSQTPAAHWTIDAVHSRIIDERLNFKHLPRAGIFGMFMNKVFLHCHLQLVSLYTSSHLWLDSLADFLWFHTRVQQGIEVIARRTSRKKFRLFSILHSSEFCSVIFKAEVPHCSVGCCSCQIHCKNLHGFQTSLHMTQTSTD